MRARLEFAAKAFVVVSFLGAAVAGVVRLRQKEMESREHMVRLGQWTVVSKPSWATVDDVRAIRDATRLNGWCASLLHPASGPLVWRAVESAPQVVRVAGIRREPPNRFVALLEIRRPVAAVRLGDAKSTRWIEVDAEGRALSAVTNQRPAREGRPLRAIVGAVVPGVPRVGDLLPAEVRDAADLSAELDRFGDETDRRLLADLDEVDVSNHRGRKKPLESEVVFRIGGAARAAASPRSAPCTVEWGRVRALDSMDTEPSFGAKATRAVQALRMFPGLAGLRTVKVAFEDLVVLPDSGSPLRAQGK